MFWVVFQKGEEGTSVLSINYNSDFNVNTNTIGMYPVNDIELKPISGEVLIGDPFGGVGISVDVDNEEIKIQSYMNIEIGDVVEIADGTLYTLQAGDGHYFKGGDLHVDDNLQVVQNFSSSGIKTTGNPGNQIIDIGDPIAAGYDGINIDQAGEEVVVQSAGSVLLGDSQGIADDTLLRVVQAEGFYFENGLVSIGAVTPSEKLEVNGNVKANQYKLSALNTAPSSATDTGALGEIRVVADYIYVCIATNTWVRTPLTTW